MVPMNDIDIYDGETIDGSFEAKSKNNWVQILDMIDLTFNNLQQQNKELKRTVNELSSKVNKVERKTFKIWFVLCCLDGFSWAKRRKQKQWSKSKESPYRKTLSRIQSEPSPGMLSDFKSIALSLWDKILSVKMLVSGLMTMNDILQYYNRMRF